MISLFVSSCAVNLNHESTIDLGKTKSIKKGITTKQDIENMFGNNYDNSIDYPYKLDDTKGKKIMVYDAGGKMQVSPIPFAGGMKAESTKLVIILNNSDVVENYKTIVESASGH